VKDDIVFQFKKFEQNDVGTTIEKMKLATIANPICKISKKTDFEERKIEQDGFNIVFQGEDFDFRRKKRILDEGITSAYSNIFSDYCRKEMQEGIKQHSQTRSTTTQ
jgi:hypothetical protein